MKGYMPYLSLELRRTLRNPRYLLFSLGFPVAFYLLFSSMFGRYSAGGTSFRVYLMVSMIVYGGVGGALMTNGPRLAAERASGWVRELRTTPLGPGAYIAARATMSLAVVLPSVAAVAVSAVLFQHVSVPAPFWLDLIVIVVLGSIPFAVLGILIGYLFDSQSAQAGTMVLYFGLSLLGGLWIPVSQMPAGLAHAAPFLPTYRFADLGWRLVQHKPFSPEDVLVLAAYTAGFLALAIYTLRHDEAREYA